MKHALIAIAALASLYALLAYIVLPVLWTHHERQLRLADRPMLTATPEHIPDDPINVGFVGDREDNIRANMKLGGMPPTTLHCGRVSKSSAACCSIAPNEQHR